MKVQCHLPFKFYFLTIGIDFNSVFNIFLVAWTLIQPQWTYRLVFLNISYTSVDSFGITGYFCTGFQLPLACPIGMCISVSGWSFCEINTQRLMRQTAPWYHLSLWNMLSHFFILNFVHFSSLFSAKIVLSLSVCRWMRLLILMLLLFFIYTIYWVSFTLFVSLSLSLSLVQSIYIVYINKYKY